MGWGSDPDSMSEAEAEGKARRSGHKEGTLEYLMAYRAAYRPVDEEEGNPYLAYLDNEIAAMKAKSQGAEVSGSPPRSGELYEPLSLNEWAGGLRHTKTSSGKRPSPIIGAKRDES